MSCAVIQPSYISWRGFFHQIQKADVFVHYDDVQYDKHGWRNRNRIKTANGTKWLTIPVHARGNVVDAIPICEVRIEEGGRWARKHWQSIQQSYAKAPFFDRYRDLLSEFYERTYDRLSDLTIDLTELLAAELGIETKFLRSSSMDLHADKNERLIQLLASVGATHYVSGPSAKSYMDISMFEAAGIEVEFMTYDYPEYEQLHPPYDPQVTVLDLMFMTGPEAPRYIW